MWETTVQSFTDLGFLPVGTVIRLQLDRYLAFQVISISILSENKIAITGSGINTSTPRELLLHFWKDQDRLMVQNIGEDNSEPKWIDPGFLVQLPKINRLGDEIPIAIPSDLFKLEIGRYLIFHLSKKGRMSFRISKLTRISELEVSGLCQLLKARGNLPNGSQVLFSFSLRERFLTFGEEVLNFSQCFWVESLRRRRSSRSSDSDGSLERNPLNPQTGLPGPIRRNVSLETLSMFDIPERPRSRSGGKELPQLNPP